MLLQAPGSLRKARRSLGVKLQLVGWGWQGGAGSSCQPKENKKKKGEGPWLGYYPRQVQVPTRSQLRLSPRTGYVAKEIDGGKE